MAILYPPIIDTYMPAFVITPGAIGVNSCKVYFSLSQYNSPADIKQVCITVNNQYTSQSVLNTVSGFKFLSLLVDETREGDDKYYIEILEEDIAGGWQVDQVYKVQVRFSSVVLEADPTINNIVNNQNNFSEWSTVCLIQGIQKPVLTLKGFSEADGDVTLTSYDRVTGKVEFADNEELESYQIKIFDMNDVQVYDSDIIYSDAFAPNEINHTIKYGFAEGARYVMHFTYTTKRMYSETVEYGFLIVDLGGQPLKAKISATPCDEDGRIAIRVTSTEEGFIGNITIRRTSSESNFGYWEDVHTTSISTNLALDYTWYDTTAESGVWYKYCAQRRSATGNRGLVVLTESPVMITLQDMFLSRGDQQLKIKFNPQVSSFKRTVSESLTQTLGSQFPFIKRNAKVNYKEFPISGLLSHFCDEEHLFMPTDELYKYRQDLYERYNEKSWITPYNDFTLERTFREKVMEFLYSNDVKLFRSPSEGNVLVRLMNVTFTPEPALGRMVYSFSATAYEIDDANIDNYSKYKIWDVGTYSDQIINEYTANGYYQGVIQDDAPALAIATSRSASSIDWVDVVALVQDIATGRESSLEKEVQSLSKVAIEINTPPYLINTTNGISIVRGPEYNDEGKITYIGDPTDEGAVLGYLILVNGQIIIIGPSGKYNISNAEITSLGFPKVKIGTTEEGEEIWTNMTVSLNYSYSVIEREKVQDVPSQLYYTSKVGQVWGYTEPMEDMYNYISDKAKYEDNESYQLLFGVDHATIEADPGTVLYIRDDSSYTYRRYQIGETGSLTIGDGSDFNLNSIYFLGKHLDSIGNKYGRTILRDNEYDEYKEEFFNYVTDVPNPVPNTVYLITNGSSGVTYHPSNIDSSLSDYHMKMSKWVKSGVMMNNYHRYTMIYYKGGWYHFDVETGDIIMPTPQLLIDYSYEVERGEYKRA